MSDAAATAKIAPLEAGPLSKSSHPDGLYFGMPEDEYHDDDALGSTDVRMLIRGPEEYWYRSAMNPRRPKGGTEATVYGTAVHKLLLEGPDAFDAVYSRRPDDPDWASPTDKGAITKRHNIVCKEEG